MASLPTDNPASFLDENAILALNGMWAAREADVERMAIFEYLARIRLEVFSLFQKIRFSRGR